MCELSLAHELQRWQYAVRHDLAASAAQPGGSGALRLGAPAQLHYTLSRLGAGRADNSEEVEALRATVEWDSSLWACATPLPAKAAIAS